MLTIIVFFILRQVKSLNARKLFTEYAIAVLIGLTGVLVFLQWSKQIGHYFMILGLLADATILIRLFAGSYRRVLPA